MDVSLKQVLQAVSEGALSPSEAYDSLKGYEDLGYVKIDHHRTKRKGFPEVIYGEGKTTEQMIGIFTHLIEKHDTVLATRIDGEKGQAVMEAIPDVRYDLVSRTLLYRKTEQKPLHSRPIGILCAGTTDLPVAEEAAITARAMGNEVKRFYDVGVAGIHRLFDQLEDIKSCSVLIVIAGMEGALPSVVGGLVNQPIIAVPTSVGYGANFQGLAPLLTMLNSCASGVSVVNIDNGFGAAYSASLINRVGLEEGE
ncbi:nickel pincer cofactor biosynthesis protein LarB [Anaerobacillus sp. MEB173]|uniref:nickel pincer cofactor biosynthesis protein LarB n=1 Tax=Anaerobacillus sp. MEB173 TaxID=3383345 RepID=UPI003F8F8854